MSRLLLSATMAALLLSSVSVRAATPPGTLVIAQSIDDAVSFDPAEGFELTTTRTANNVYQRLVQPDRADPSKILPGLASSWSEDPKGHALVFALQAGSVFASGNPVRPEDVIFSLSRAVKLKRPRPSSSTNSAGRSTP